MHASSSPCLFIHHPGFIQDLNEFIAKHGSNDASSEETIANHQNLLLKHFYKNSPMYTKKHLGLAQGFVGYTVYWLHMIIPNCRLTRTQFPKAYFYKDDGHICFLCLDSHLQNYKDSKLRTTAILRLQEMIGVLKSRRV